MTTFCMSSAPGFNPDIHFIAYHVMQANINKAPVLADGGDDPSFIVEGNTTDTTINTYGPGDVVEFDLVEALGSNPVSIDDSQGLATAKINEGSVAASQVDFLDATNVNVTGGDFEVNSAITAADVNVSPAL